MAKNSVISQQQKPLTKKQQRFFKNIGIIINNTAKKYDQIWRKRSRKIDSKFLINFILNILSSKNQGYAIILNKMWNVYISKNIEFPQAKVFSQSSLCEARQKLPEEIFKDLNSNLIKEFEKDKTKSFLIENHRIFAVDGSKVTLPKNLENENYKVNNQGAHYPKGLLSCIYNLKNYIIHDFSLKDSLCERTPALEHLRCLREEDVVIYDRGYFSYHILYEHYQNKIHPIFRLQQGLRNQEIDDFIDNDQKDDEIITYVPADTLNYKLKKKGIDINLIPIEIRLIKYFINNEIYIIATTLLDQDKYKTHLFKELYHKRWDIEELYKISKVVLDLENFHSKTQRGVKQEIYAHFVLINIARFFEFECDKSNLLDNRNQEKKYKFNFKNSLEVIKTYIEELLFTKITNFLKKIPLMLYCISRVKQKIRPHRKYSRISYQFRNKWGLDRKNRKIYGALD